MASHHDVDVFNAIAGGQHKSKAQLKKDLNFGTLMDERREKQLKEAADRERKLPPGRRRRGDSPGGAKKVIGMGKHFHLAGVSVTAAEAKAAEKSINAPIRAEDPHRRQAPPATRAEREALERALFQEKFGIDFDKAVEDLIEADKKKKGKGRAEEAKKPEGPSEGRLFLVPPEGLVEAARAWHPDLFPPEDTVLKGDGGGGGADTVAQAKHKKKKRKKKQSAKAEAGDVSDDEAVKQQVVVVAAVAKELEETALEIATYVLASFRFGLLFSSSTITLQCLPACLAFRAV